MKKLLCLLLTASLLFFFLVFPDEALAASRRGLALWFDRLLPTLLPFTVLSYVILRSGLLAPRGTISRRIGTREWYVILCGFLFGFPIGGKLTADLYREGQLSAEHARILFFFTNNLSPAFVTMALVEILGLSAGPLSYAVLYGIPLVLCLAGLLLHPDRTAAGQKDTASSCRLDMQTVDAGIVNGFEALIKICGYVVLFSLAAELIRLLPLDLPMAKTLLIGCTEVTTGMQEVSGVENPNLRYILGLALLSWGGVSGCFQTASIAGGTDLPMKRYLIVRLALALATAGAAALLVTLGLR